MALPPWGGASARQAGVKQGSSITATVALEAMAMGSERMRRPVAW
jgi:hypothetical protein